MSPERATEDKNISEAIRLFKEDAKKRLAASTYRKHRYLLNLVPEVWEPLPSRARLLQYWCGSLVGFRFLTCGTTLLTPESKFDELPRTAIEHRRIIRLRYRSSDRIVEPRDYGIQNGRLRLLAYQIGGCSSGPLPNWRWMDVDQISDLHLLDRTFKGGRTAPSGNHHKWGPAIRQSKAGRCGRVGSNGPSHPV